MINNKNFTSKNSYDTLKEFASNPYKIYTLNKSGKIDLNKVISPFVNTKIENFIKNVMINLDNTVFVCKFDKSKSYASGEDFQDFNYMIVQNDNDRYYVLLLRKDDNDKYLPISNQVFDSYEELTGKMFNILQNQEITMLSSIKVFSNGLLLFQRGIANDLRLNKSLMLKHISDELGCVPNKTRVIQLPRLRADLYRHFIRGFFDGDGCLQLQDKKYRCRFDSTSASKRFLEQVRPIITAHAKTNGYLGKESKYEVWHLNYSGYQVQDILDWLYKDSNFYLQRKYTKYKLLSSL